MTEQDQLKLAVKAVMLHDANNTCLTVDECAKYLKMHRSTVIRKIDSGKILATLKAGAYRIPKLQFLNEIINENSDQS